MKIKNVAADTAKELLNDGRPAWVEFVREHQGAESSLFKSKFKESWTEYIDSPENFQKRRNNIVAGVGVVLNVRAKEINVDKMHNPR